MNIVDFWEKQITKWDEEQKCGMCWSFKAPLSESAVNIVQPEPDKECCVQVFLVRERVPAFNTTYNYNATTGFANDVTCTTGFQLLFLVPSNIGLNNYNEIEGHPEAESKWNTILWKLEDCLKCELALDFCEFLGSQQRVTRWEGQQAVNYLDNAYTGYRVTVNFQQVK